MTFSPRPASLRDASQDTGVVGWRPWSMRPSPLVASILRRFTRLADALSLAVRRWMLADPHFPAKFHPIAAAARSYLIGPTETYAGDTLPVPPPELWLGYANDAESYLRNGQARADRLKRHVAEAGFTLTPTARVLDFGCASGIMLRWFAEFTARGEVWGVDIAAKPILWCQTHICPPFKCVTSTAFPHLPFEDNYFDLIYAGSVFTHIADLADLWLLELRRITKRGGVLFLTVHDNAYIDLVMHGVVDNPRMRERLRRFDAESQFVAKGFSMFAVNRAPGHGASEHAQVFYDADFLRRQWGNVLDVVAMLPQALGGPQTGVILRKG